MVIVEIGSERLKDRKSLKWDPQRKPASHDICPSPFQLLPMFRKWTKINCSDLTDDFTKNRYHLIKKLNHIFYKKACCFYSGHIHFALYILVKGPMQPLSSSTNWTCVIVTMLCSLLVYEWIFTFLSSVLCTNTSILKASHDNLIWKSVVCLNFK